jgi:hypothetical protein
MKNFIRRFAYVALIGWLALAIADNQDTCRTAQAKTKDTSPVIVGVPLPLSGNLKEFGTMMRNSFEMAIETPVLGHSRESIFGRGCCKKIGH